MRSLDPRKVTPVDAMVPGVGAVLDAQNLTLQLADEAHTEAPVGAVFNPSFLAAHAGVASLEALLEKAGLPPAETVDRAFLRALGNGTLDRIVSDTTDFDCWADFEEAAARAYVARRMMDFVL